MEITLSELKEKEVVNAFDGKKLGRIVDLIFDADLSLLLELVLPGEKRLFKKSEDLFIPVSKISKIGKDVILVILETQLTENLKEKSRKIEQSKGEHPEKVVYARYKKYTRN